MLIESRRSRRDSPKAPLMPARRALSSTAALCLTFASLALAAGGCARADDSASAATAAVTKPGQLGLCASCHGEDGRARMPATPHLDGQDEAYLVAALTAYRDGTRPHAAMRAIAGSLRDDDIAALARWYAAQRGAAP
jgi:cytochrome c553